MALRILYVEDNPFNLRLVKKMLETSGIEVIGAPDGNTGVEMAQLEQPHLVLLDMNLPDVDGMEVFRRLRFDLNMQIPIVALTANAMYGDRERFLNAGCNSYISKPVDRRELLNAISQFVEISEMR